MAVPYAPVPNLHQTSYKTTRPRIPLTQARQNIETRVNNDLNIQLRPFLLSDLEHAHRLRTQEAVMRNTSTGVVDANLDVTQQWMNRFLPPNDAHTYDWMLWVKQDDQEWENIGSLGVHIMKPVPHIGYMIRSEWWGKKIVSIAVKAFLDDWWTLEREEVVLRTDDTVDEHDLYIMGLEGNQSATTKDASDAQSMLVPEILLAEVEENNMASIRVVEKCGFQLRDRETLLENGGVVVLRGYVQNRPFS